MRKKIAWISSAATAGLLVAGFAVAASPSTGHTPAHAVLAANTASSPPVNLDNCPTLSKGYQGGCINQLQTELNADDGANLPVDGIFGPLTQQAVITFQKDHGVTPADGIVGPLTKAALDGVSPAPSQPSVPAASTVNLDNCPVLQEGSQGSCVNQLQTELNTIDNAGLPVDGIFGPQTQQAVITFQQNNGITQDNGVPARGIVGPVTKQALDTELATPTTAGLGQTPTSGGPTTSSPSPAGPDSSPSGSSEIADTAEGALGCGVGGLVLGVVTANPFIGGGADVACEVIGHDVLGGTSPDPAG